LGQFASSITSVFRKGEDDADVELVEDEVETIEEEDDVLPVDGPDEVDVWLEEEDEDKLEDVEREVAVTTEVLVLGVVVVEVDTVAKYKPTPATSKITTMITTTSALEIALRLFLSDILRITRG
jgi:hypothetical protein